MDALNIKGILRKAQEGYLLIPATRADAVCLSTFADTKDKRFVSITMKNAKATKRYNQVKTVWALIRLIFVSLNKRLPSELEQKMLYNYLVSLYAEKEPVVTPNGDIEYVPVTLSEMSARQASMFILALIKVLSDCDQVDYESKIEVSEIFKEWLEHRGYLKTDYCDCNEDGEYLDVDTWRELNTMSFASGSKENLEIAHIVSKGSDEIHRDCVWNMMLLTHEEHIEVQHRYGWDYFLEIYPHLRGRVERAREIAGKLERLEEENDYNEP